MTDTVEAVARALTGYVCQQSLCSARLGWKDDDKNCPCRQAARAAIAAYASHSAAMPKPGTDSADLVKRLVLLGQSVELETHLPNGHVAIAAASLIEAQAARIAELEDACRKIIMCGLDEDMDAETAWQTMDEIARAALGEKP